MENLARYIIRTSFSQERMTYVPEESKVIYQSKDGKEEKAFDALEWLAAMCSRIPNKGEQMVRYYGYYSNVSRGRQKKGNRETPPLQTCHPSQSLARPDNQRTQHVVTFFPLTHKPIVCYAHPISKRVLITHFTYHGFFMR